jgi:hypothetical protein
LVIEIRNSKGACSQDDGDETGDVVHSLEIDLINFRISAISTYGIKRIARPIRSAANRTISAIPLLRHTLDEIQAFACDLFYIEIAKGKILLIWRTCKDDLYRSVEISRHDFIENMKSIEFGNNYILNQDVKWIDVHVRIPDMNYITANDMRKQSALKCVEFLVLKGRDPSRRYTREELFDEARERNGHLTRAVFDRALGLAERQLMHTLLVTGRPVGPRSNK